MRPQSGKTKKPEWSLEGKGHLVDGESSVVEEGSPKPVNPLQYTEGYWDECLLYWDLLLVTGIR